MVSPLVIRNNVRISGRADGRAMVFVHGFGCAQGVWRAVSPAFEADHRVVLYDHVGSGNADPSAYSAQRYASLGAYAEDLVEIAESLGVQGGVMVGHSVGATIGILAARLRPGLFDHLVLVGPSPRYVNTADYVGGFEQRDIDDLLDTLASNHLGWSRQMAPVIMGRPDRPDLEAELTESFCRTDPRAAEGFARATFLADNREDLPHIQARTLVLQCTDDPIAPVAVGDYVHRQIPGSQLVAVETSGHCPHMSEPDAVIRAMRDFLR
ncbi:alpha/beta fold hydrolase [Luteitalea sp. TBR-22]|uniref:alpha/beta fold hydrolase n=1 Tax=Luteitalea sp. TBR-22 TaxID=2802971 RepID=UPI001EF446EF|nr:alpha/beta hydrolase [Luteitalea sp. TBR-22]